MSIHLGKRRWPRWVGYAIATIAIAAVVWLRLGLEPMLGPQGPIALLLFAVVVSAYVGGMGPGLYASIATSVLGALLFLRHDEGHLGAREQVLTASYMLVALTITWLCERLRDSAVFNREIAAHLEESRARLGSLLDSVTDGLVAVGPSFKVTQINEEALEAMGASGCDLGGSLWDVAPHWVSTEIEAKVRESLATLTPQRLEQFDEKRSAWLDVSIYPSAHGLVIYLRDITVRKRHEADVARISHERARAYAKLDALLANAPIGLAYFDQNHRYLRINNYLAEINGVPALDSIGRPVDEMLPSLAAAIEPLLDQVFRTRLAIQNVEIAGETPREPNVSRSWLMSFYPVLDDAGGVQAVGTIVTEITDRKRHEELLRSSEERYRSLVSASSSIVWSADEEGRFRDPQPSWQRFTGQSRGEPQGEGWLEAFHPDDRERIRDEWRRTLDLKLIFQTQARLWNALTDGYRHVAIRAAPVLNGDHSVREWVGTVSDVHETRLVEDALRASEERNRLLVEVAANVVWSTDAEGRMAAPQAQWETATGQSWPIQQENGWIGRFAKEDRAAVRKALRTGIDEARPQSLEARLWSAASEEYRYVNVHCVPLRRLDGGVSEWIWMATDVHEKRLWEHEREGLLAAERAARGEAERANRLKDDFIATMSHELRTPLTTILGWAELLQIKHDQRETLLQGLETIERSTRIQAQLIEDLLDVSRIESGKLRLEMEDVDLGSVVSNAVDSLHQSADAKDLVLTTRIEEGACRVYGDEERLTQVVWNILNNAVKFTPTGGQIRVEMHREGEQALLRISDNGDGIAADFLPHLFERFRQADATSSRKHGGLGLGLAIVKQLVEMHGGTVEASSDGPGHGATFEVRLPVLHSSAASGDRRPEPNLELRGVRLMVVDDDPDTTEVLKRLLEVQGASVSVFHSADEALEAMTEHPDVLISDLGMPRKDGLQMIREWRGVERDRRTPAIAVTAFAREEEREIALKSGFDDHVAKPIDTARLTECIKRVMNGRLPDDRVASRGKRRTGQTARR